MNGIWKRHLVSSVAIIALLMTAMFGMEKAQGQAEITYLSLPSESIPLGVAYNDHSVLWVALYWFGAIAKMNITTGEYEIFYVKGYESHEVGCYGLAIDGSGNVWVTERTAQRVAKFNPATERFTELSLLGHSPAGVIYHQGYIWVCNRPYLTKISPDTMEIVNFNFGDNSSPYMLVGDGDYIWVSETEYPYGEYPARPGRVHRFSILAETIEVMFTGLDRPLGLVVYRDFVYVAENKRRGEIDPGIELNGTIAKCRISDGSISRIVTAPITNEGPYMVYFDSDLNLWWTDNSFHIGVIGLTKEVYDSKPYCYFLTQIATKIYFSCVGSAAIGVVDMPLPGDINGDKIVDILDLSITGIAYGCFEGDPDYNAQADINKDGIVDMRDICVIGWYWGESR